MMENMMDETPLYNSRIIKNYVEYLKSHYSNIDIGSLLKYAGIEAYQLDDEGHWLSQKQVDRFHEMLAEKTNNPDISREVGRYSVTSQASGALRQYLLGFISPATAYAVLEKLNSRFTRAAKVISSSIGEDKIEARVTLIPDVKEKPYQCLNRLGALEAIAKLFTGKFAKIEHPVCLHKGGDCCLYTVSWEKPPTFVWKRIRNYSFIVGFIASVLSVSLLPPIYWDVLVLVCILVVMGITFYAEHLEKKVLIATVESQGDAADRLVDQINTSYNNALLVQEIGQATSMILEINPLLAFIMEALEKRLDFDRGMIMLANREQTRLVYTIGYGYNQEHREYLENMEFHLDNPHSRGAFVLSFRKQTPLLINNIDEIAKDFSPRSVEFAKKMGTRSFICVPIVFKGESMGVLVVDNIRSKRLLSQSDMSLLMGIAPQIAISINNAMAYRRIAESEKKFRSLSESTPDIIYTIDTHGIFTYVNPAWERILGYGSEEAIGRHFIDFVRKDEVPLYIDMFKSIQDKGVTIRDQIGTLINKDGSDRFFSISGAPVFDSEGRMAGVVGTFKDVTERKLAEVKLERERAFLRQVIDAVPSFISVRDTEGRFQLANKSLAKACGTTPAQLIHKTMADFNPNQEVVVRQMHADNLDVIQNRKEKIIPEETSAYPDPSVKWLSTHKVPLIDQDDACSRILTVSTNITHEKEAEEEKTRLQNQLIQIQKMEAVGTLAGGVAHDFNNILMGLQGYISMLLYDMSPDHPHRTKLENMENYVNRGSDLTRQLLGFARGGKYDVKPTNINRLLGKSADLFGRTRKEISIYRSFAEDAWSVDVDQGQIDQVFLNLFINASQAMPGGGDLDLRTENVLFLETDEKPLGVTAGRYVRLTVRDNGTGMDSKTLERIFEPFFTTKQKGSGTGLGLASAYGIIKNHGGSIHAFSEPKKGTSFHIYLPATDQQPVVHQEKRDEIFTGRETILIVDDEPINISVMQEMLEMLHYRVLPAGSGEEAVAIYMEKQKEIDVVILDMVMPGISGGRTFDLLREINPDVGVILASGYSADGEARKIIDRGCWGFIQKPFKLQEFSRKIREVLDHHGMQTTT